MLNSDNSFTDLMKDPKTSIDSFKKCFSKLYSKKTNNNPNLTTLINYIEGILFGNSSSSEDLSISKIIKKLIEIFNDSKEKEKLNEQEKEIASFSIRVTYIENDYKSAESTIDLRHYLMSKRENGHNII